MTRKSLLKLTFAATIAFAAPLFNPPSTQATVGYTCSGTYTSSTHTGTGSTCANADSAVRAQGIAEATGYCNTFVLDSDGYCPHGGVQVTSACTYLGNGLYSESGYILFGCRRCGYPGGPICP
jgi:hypothetical protein